MTQTAVTDQIDDDILVELVAVVQGHAGDENDRLRVITVDVEDRGLDHLGDVGAVGRGTHVQGVAGGKANLVVDHHMQGPAGAVTAGLGELQGLGHHALTGEGRITVDKEGEDLVTGAVAAAALAGTHRAFDDRIDDLQVGGVKAQNQVDAAARGLHVGGEAHVVLDVPSLVAHVGDAALEFVKESLGWLAQEVDEDIESAAMGHANDDLLDTLAPGALDQLIHQGDHGLATFQRKAFLANIAGVEITFQTLRRRQQGQQPAAILGLQFRLSPVAFQPLLNPAFFLNAGDVHVLRAHGPAVNLPQEGDNIAQAHAVGGVEGAGMENLIQIRLPQLIKSRVQVLDRRLLTQMDGVQVGSLMTSITIGIDEPQDRGLLLRRRRLQSIRGTDQGPNMTLPRQAQEIFLDGTMGYIIRGPAAHDVEALPPGQIHALGIGEVTLVQVFDEGRVASIQRARGAKHLDQSAHGGYKLRRLSLSLSMRLWRALGFSRDLANPGLPGWQGQADDKCQ